MNTPVTSAALVSNAIARLRRHIDSELFRIEEAASTKSDLNFSQLKLEHVPGRMETAFSYLRPRFSQLIDWIVMSNEITNFTYELSPRNIDYLSVFLGHISGVEPDQVRRYIEEIETDEDLRQTIREAGLRSKQAHLFDETISYGRRIGWYALARLHKPRVIIETGVEKGLGSAVLCAALRRNSQEGAIGTYYGTDIDVHAGYLLTPPYSEYGTILYGDSIESLRSFSSSIDLFINDSDHCVEYEAQEYEVVREKLSPKALVLSDNAHVTDALMEFSLRSGRKYLYWQEKPVHWYPGAGIGVSWC